MASSSSSSNTSWVKTITTPFRKARTLFNPNGSSTRSTHKSHLHHQGHEDKRMMDLQLQGEVMACPYEDVQVMWSILDKSNQRMCNVSS
ncbi:hypothetical protein DCAR_0726869 [Daucus carota subsp. sativus]|uniref:Uncharacterized protein n=1 Tax=Daucus carota subsp. sativus TaxID=79200 RepID=A0A164SLE4_DAUCS|nr:PREDICTED: uncharacterized protein LOC108195239 [Daucus carota subsp. sativus]WOH07439.1 hypothetical protein DCAR_0726869 [Daucus carota subsp. sativus]